eukprot:2769836-Rhodomonas_salina.1
MRDFANVRLHTRVHVVCTRVCSTASKRFPREREPHSVLTNALGAAAVLTKTRWGQLTDAIVEANGKSTAEVCERRRKHASLLPPSHSP